MAGYENSAGIGVNNYYGARDTGGSVGIETGKDSTLVVSLNLTGDSLNSTFMPPYVVPKGAILRRAVLRVDEAFTLGGTSPTVNIGLAGSVATNYIILTQGELQAVGTKVPASTGSGTLSTTSTTGVTAADKIGKTLAGTSPTVAKGVGKATLTLEFYNKGKA